MRLAKSLSIATAHCAGRTSSARLPDRLAAYADEVVGSANRIRRQQTDNRNNHQEFDQGETTAVAVSASARQPPPPIVTFLFPSIGERLHTSRVDAASASIFSRRSPPHPRTRAGFFLDGGFRFAYVSRSQRYENSINRRSFRSEANMKAIAVGLFLVLFLSVDLSGADAVLPGQNHPGRGWLSRRQRARSMGAVDCAAVD